MLFASLFGFMTNRSLTRAHADLFLRFVSAEGLQKGDAVLFHGVQVGEVKQLRFADGGGVLVRLRLTKAVALQSGAYGELVAADLFGRQSVALRQGSGLQLVADADTLAGAAASSLTDVMKRLGERAGRVLGAPGAQPRAGDRSGRTGPHSREPGRLDRGAGAGRGRMDTAGGMLIRLLAELEAGEGTAGRLLADPALYDRTAAALTSLEALLEEVRRNPKRHINVSIF